MDVCIIKDSLIVIMFFSFSSMLSYCNTFCPFYPICFIEFYSIYSFFCCIHKQAKAHECIFCLWDLFGHDVNLYYFLYNFLPMNLHYLQTNLLGKKMYISICHEECMYDLSYDDDDEKRFFFTLLSNSIIEYFVWKLYAITIALSFVYQQQQ